LKRHLNQNEKVAATCLGVGYEWRVYTSPVLGGNTSMVKNLKDKHTCIRPSIIKAGNSTCY
jgi:hypothetical protein